MPKNPFVGKWTYRSLLNEPDGTIEFNKLEFGEGTIQIDDSDAPELLTGTIGGQGWSLALHGSRGYGSPAQGRFQGKGIVGGEQGIYDYIGWLGPGGPHSTASIQPPAHVGSVNRAI